MFKILRLTFIGILCCIATWTSSSAGIATLPDKINWELSHRLSFNDFKGLPDQDTLSYEDGYEVDALAKITKAILVKSRTNNKEAEFTISAVMDRNRSWILHSNDSASLKHEQGHFDICEIYARHLRKDIAEARSFSEARSLYDQIIREEENEQNLYDNDNSGIPEGISSYWSEKIKSQLAGLVNYDNPQLSVKF